MKYFAGIVRRRWHVIAKRALLAALLPPLLLSRCAFAENSAAADLFALLNSEKALAFHPLGKRRPPLNPGSYATCRFASPISAKIHRLLLQFYLHTGGGRQPIAKSTISLTSLGLCSAAYLGLGNQRFLIDYEGLGILNLRTHTYTRPLTPNADGELISKSYVINERYAVRLYSFRDSQGAEDFQLYDALLFSPEGPGAVQVRIAFLGGAALVAGRADCLAAEKHLANYRYAPDGMFVSPPRISVDRAVKKLYLSFTAEPSSCQSKVNDGEAFVITFVNGEFWNWSKREIQLRPVGNEKFVITQKGDQLVK